MTGDLDVRYLARHGDQVKAQDIMEEIINSAHECSWYLNKKIILSCAE